MSSVSSAASPSVEPRPSLPDQLTHVANALQDCELNARRVGALDTGRRLLGMQRLLEQLRETARSASDSLRDRAEQLSQKHAYLLNEAVRAAPFTISPPAPAATPPLSTYFPGGQDRVTPLVLAYLPATEERQALVAGDTLASARSQQVLALQHQMRNPRLVTPENLREQTRLLEEANMARVEQGLPPLDPLVPPPPLSTYFQGGEDLVPPVVLSYLNPDEQNALVAQESPASARRHQLLALHHLMRDSRMVLAEDLREEARLLQEANMARAEQGLRPLPPCSSQESVDLGLGWRGDAHLPLSPEYNATAASRLLTDEELNAFTCFYIRRLDLTGRALVEYTDDMRVMHAKPFLKILNALIAKNREALRNAAQYCISHGDSRAAELTNSMAISVRAASEVLPTVPEQERDAHPAAQEALAAVHNLRFHLERLARNGNVSVDELLEQAGGCLSIDLRGTALNQVAIINLLTQFFRLRELDIRDTLTLGPVRTQQLLQSLPVHCPYLRSLRITGSEITDEGLRVLVRGLANLEDLELGDANLGDIFQIGDNGIREFAVNGTDLRRLQIHNCRRITAAGLEVLSMFPRLAYLGLQHTAINDDTLGLIFAGCRRLREIDLNHCTQITRTGLSLLALRPLRDIANLVSRCSMSSDPVLRAQARNCIRDWSLQNTRALIELCAKSPNERLRALAEDCRGCHRIVVDRSARTGDAIHDRWITLLAASHPELQTLQIGDDILNLDELVSPSVCDQIYGAMLRETIMDQLQDDLAALQAAAPTAGAAGTVSAAAASSSSASSAVAGPAAAPRG